ncbi:hypothetical protein RFI_34548 [Reticulomyxa filosa]|uniref:Uncharacterized protein n=1 Tax=Reticulomyxa filosa TaxID=46433 RepID=X6LMQ6_RETFI|nr:hypothetical protein RFI_34548 [Reticulomyxa filosa]|eukprot:ETO02864.1 hypothetical protein RFI_34548 [Reticulomyxa filosa]
MPIFGISDCNYDTCLNFVVFCSNCSNRIYLHIFVSLVSLKKLKKKEQKDEKEKGEIEFESNKDKNSINIGDWKLVRCASSLAMKMNKGLKNSKKELSKKEKKITIIEITIVLFDNYCNCCKSKTLQTLDIENSFALWWLDAQILTNGCCA